MINEIIAGVAEALNENFPCITIYTETMPQNLQAPAFFIYAVEGTRIYRYRGQRWKAEIKIGIAYYTENSDVNSEVNGVLDMLFICCEYINADGIMRRGTQAKAEDAEGYVYFTVNYDFFFIVTDEQEFMQTLKAEVSTIGRTEEKRKNGSEVHETGSA